jgi:hypothetical protein
MTTDLKKRYEEDQKARSWLDEHAERGDSWQVLVDGETVYLSLHRPSDLGEVELKHELTLARFKSIALRAPSRLVEDMCVALPQDAKQTGGADLYIWLTEYVSTKFRVSYYKSERSTPEAVDLFRRRR